ncbi:MAG: hypothetical protein ACMVY4_07000 [Minwuia sp.]|uniref:hypothetical protein n=1 Tax=Minwuia sp. TaxID=2493630 RepID=UPI003A8493CD
MIEPLLAALEASSAAQWLRGARWGYAAVNAAHIFGLALLIGAILPLDLRLLGFWKSVDRRALTRVLAPVAATGLALAIAAGFCLFAIRAREYAALDVFRIKLLLIVAGAGAAVLLHARAGWLLDRAEAAALRRHALISMVCWLGALICGRLIAFVT